jgi:hypothetical protein
MAAFKPIVAFFLFVIVSNYILCSSYLGSAVSNGKEL